MIRATAIAALLASLACGWAYAQGNPALPPVPKACEAIGANVVTSSPLANVAAALKDRKRINILAIGSTAASLRGPVSGDTYALVEQFLEANFKGLDVNVVHRGVSGELAADAAQRIKTEVALSEADLVLWQLGTADAMARVPVADFYAAVSETLAWLEAHKVDVILIGMRYARSMAKDLHYQAIRTAIREVARQRNVQRLGRYEAEETLEKVRQKQGPTLVSELQSADMGAACVAEHLARAIAAGLFVRDPQPAPQPAPEKPKN
jgi:lysophospholipase L1-like esterase